LAGRADTLDGKRQDFGAHATRTMPEAVIRQASYVTISRGQKASFL